ncbi:MAG: HDOD domain-containing protein [bacterium]
MKKELYHHTAFNGLNDNELIDLYNIVSIKNFNPGEYLFEEGDVANSAFLIAAGSVKIIKKEDNRLREIVIYYKGDLIGEIAFVKQNNRTATAYAVEPTTAISINQSSLNTLKPTTQVTIYKNLVTMASERIFHVIRQERESFRKNNYLVNYICNTLLAKNEEYAHCTMIQKIIKKIPRLPMYASKLAIMLNDEKVSIQEVVDLVKQDPSLVGVVLKTVNSAFYGLKNTITDFRRAVLLLGFNQLYQLVLESGLRKTMPNTPEFQELQFHSYLVSLVVLEISQLIEVVKPIRGCTIALLHDIGKSVILLLKMHYKDSTFFIDLLNHARVGSLLLKEWNIPDYICTCIEYQNFPVFAPPEKIPEEIRRDIALVYVAHLSYDYLRGISDGALPVTFFNEYAYLLNLPEKSLPKLVKNNILPGLNKKIDSFPENVRKFLEHVNNPAKENDNSILKDVDFSIKLPQ